MVRLGRTSLSADTRGLRGARHLSVHFLCTLTRFCAIATHYDKTARTFLAAVYQAGTAILLT